MNRREAPGLPAVQHERQAAEEPARCWGFCFRRHFLDPADRRRVITQCAQRGVLNERGPLEDHAHCKDFCGQFEVRIGDAAIRVVIRYHI